MSILSKILLVSKTFNDIKNYETNTITISKKHWNSMRNERLSHIGIIQTMSGELLNNGVPINDVAKIIIKEIVENNID